MTATKKRNDNERWITSVTSGWYQSTIISNVNIDMRTARTHIDVARSRMRELGC